MTRILLATILGIACAGCGITQTSQTPVRKFHLHGTVRKLDNTSHAATIQHDNIEGFMEAMTMEYPIKDRAEYEKLRVGEVIDATVFVQDINYWVGEISEAKGEKPAK